MKKVKAEKMRLALIDIVTIGLMYFLLLLSFRSKVPWMTRSQFILGVVLISIIYIVCNYFFGCYNFSLYRIGVYEYLRQWTSTVCAGGLIAILYIAGIIWLPVFGLTVIPLLAGSIFWGIRYLYQIDLILKSKLFNGKTNDIKRVLIYGAGSRGAHFASSLIMKPEERLLPVAFIDDNKSLCGTKVNGIKVFGGQESLKKTVEEQGIDLIIISVGKVNNSRMREISELCLRCKRPVQILPVALNVKQYSRISRKDLKSLNIEDLLGRSEVKLEREWIDRFIKGKVVLVTGGSGSIGSEICRQVLAFGCEQLIAFDFNENGLFFLEKELSPEYGSRIKCVHGSIRDIKRVDDVIKKHKPAIVFHAAAHKHVPVMEFNPLEAVKNNIFGTLNVIKVCSKYNVGKFILISTDKAVNPVNIMGATKRMAELILLAYQKKICTEMAAVRFGNVLGSTGSVVPIFFDQIALGGPVTITHRDMQRYFMTIPEAVQLVLQAGALAKGGEIFMLDMGEPVSIYKLASDLILLSGYEPDVDIMIKETGIRPGEKLFEELSYSSDNVDKTEHEKIYVCKPGKIDKVEVDEQLSEFYEAIEQCDEGKAVELLSSLMPEKYERTEKIEKCVVNV